MEKPIIMYDSPEAATYRTNLKGWVASDGRYYAENEHSARWAGSTHQKCECGNTFGKGRTICDSCHSKNRTEKYYALPMVEWDGTTPVCTFDDDRFFFDEDSLLDYMADMKHEEPDVEHEVQLVLCEPGKLRLIDHDDWCDDLPEDGELPDEVAQKVTELNEAIKRAPVVSWWAGTTRINVDSLWEQLKKEVSE